MCGLLKTFYKNAIVFLILFSFQPVIASTVLGEVLTTVGKASAVHKNKKRNLKNGDKVYDQEVIETSRGSLVIIRFQEGSMIKLSGASKMKLRPPGSQTGLELLLGSVFSFVKPQKNKKAKKHFRIRTKTMVAGVRGTEFFTSYGPKNNPDDNWLCVKSGQVRVTALGQNQSTVVGAGSGVSISKKGSVSKPQALPWTQKLNWNMDSQRGDIKNSVDIESAYSDLLNEDYD